MAGVGPAGLKLQVFNDELSAPAGKALVRVVQASLKEHQVTVSYGSDVLASKLPFGSSTAYTALTPGTGTVKLRPPREAPPYRSPSRRIRCIRSWSWTEPTASRLTR